MAARVYICVVVMHVRCGLIYFDYKKSGLYQNIYVRRLYDVISNIVQQEYSALYGTICSRRVTVNGIYIHIMMILIRLWRYVIVMRERNVMMIAPMVATEYCENTMMM